MRSDATYLGSVLRVTGSAVLIELSRDLPSAAPVIGGHLHRIGQIGSFVRIPVGLISLYAIVSMVGVSESLPQQQEVGIFPVVGRRWMEAQLIGETAGTLPFQRGTSITPTIDDEVHVITQHDLERIYTNPGSAPVTIGFHASSDGLEATIDVEKIVTRHAGIFGSTGSGKSNSVAALLRAISKGAYPNARIVIFDPHGEYGTALGDISRVMKIGDTTNPLIIPYWALPYDEFAWFFTDKKSSDTGADLALREYIFDEKLKAAKSIPGLNDPSVQITIDSPVPFDLKKAWFDLDWRERATFKTNECKPGDEDVIDKGDASKVISAKFKPPGLGSASPFKNKATQNMAPQLGRMATRLRDRRFSFLCNPEGYALNRKDLPDLLNQWLAHNSPITIFDLGGVPTEVIDLIVATVTRILFEVSFWGRDDRGVGREGPILLIYEEAHSYLPKQGPQTFIEGFARKAVQRVFKEGRKYGLGAVVVSQRPSELDDTVMSQCGTMCALRLSNSQDQASIKAVVPDAMAGILDILPSLRTGEALVLGEAIAIPSRIRLPLIEPRPKSDDPKVKERWQDARELKPEFQEAVYSWRTQNSSKSSAKK